MWATNTLRLFHSRRVHIGAVCALVLSILLLNIGLLSPPVGAVQTIPYKINFQGRLTDASGNIKPDGQYNMKLRLWTASGGGSNVWTEIRGDNGVSNANRVQVTNGLFSIQLGDVTALSPTLFSNGTYPLYLEVELPTPGTALCTGVNCTSYTEGAMTPRSALGSSAYAFSADTLDGIDGSSMARVDSANTFAASNSFNSGTTNTFNGNLVLNNTGTVTNNSLLGFNIGGTSGAYTLQSNGTGGYFYSDGTSLHLGITAAGTSGGSVNPTNRDDDVTVIANITNGIGAAINAGVGFGNTLVDNGSFEFSMAGWRANGLSGGFTYTAETANPRTGNYNLKFAKAAASDNGSLYQRMNFATPGESYFASSWVKTSVATNGTGGLRIIFLDKTGAPLGTTNSTMTNPGTSYVQRTVTATAPANTVLMKIEVFANNDGTTGGDWYFDDVYGQRSDRIDPTLFKNATNSTTAFQIQNASGAALLVADTSSLALKVGGGDVSPDSSPALLVLDYNNSATDPAGTNGGMYYNSSTNKFRCYENSTWRDCIPSGMSRYNVSEDFMFTNTNPVNGTVINPWMIFGAGGGGSASYVAGVANHPGLLRLAPSYNFSTTLQGGSTGYSAVSPITFGTGAWTYTAITRINVISNATNRYLYYLGFSDNNAGANPNNGCYLQYSDTINSGKWQGVCERAGSGTTVCDTGLSAAISTWYTINIGVNAAGTAATFAINGSSCTVSANVPTAAVSQTFLMQQSAGTANIDMDYVEVSGEGLAR